MIFKKILAGILAAVVAVGSLSMAAFAEDDALVSGDFEYEVLEDGTVGITKYLGDDENVVIPDTINDMAVSMIDYGAFSYCTSLVEIVIPDSVKEIRNSAFSGCTSLISIVVAENNTNYASVDGILFDKNLSALIMYPANKENDEYKIPDSVVTIKSYAFSDCTSLKEIVIPDSVTAIEAWAFSSCASLTKIAIPNSVTAIEAVTFISCTSLREIVIPGSVTTIGEAAFQSCTSLTEIVIPDGVTTIEPNTFYGCTSLTKVVIPDSVTIIYEWAFQSCTSLKEIVIPDSVTTIRGSAFEKCTSLTEITIPDSVTEIGMFAFSGCTSLIKIVIPDSVISINDWAFTGCTDDLTIYGYTGSYAETFAKENGINFVALDKESDSNTSSKEPVTIEDKETGIEISAAEGVLPEGAVLNVEIDEEKSTENAVAFDITVAVDGKPADINGNVTVTIPVPEELKGADTYYVFYKADDGTLTDMKATCKDGVITFTTNHFSTYIVSTVNLLANNKGDSPNTGIEGVAIFAGLAVAAAAAAVISKKRK